MYVISKSNSKWELIHCELGNAVGGHEVDLLFWKKMAGGEKFEYFAFLNFNKGKSCSRLG